MSLSVKTQGGSVGFFPSIFVTGLAETDTVYASKGGKTVQGKWDESRSGFLISPLRELGMWTVTATNGEKTKTVDALADVATEFEFSIDLYKLWLYREGDEFEEVTGGWGMAFGENNYSPSFMKNANNMVAKISGRAHDDHGSLWMSSANPIDLTGYTKLCLEGTLTNSANQSGLLTGVGLKATKPTTVSPTADIALNNGALPDGINIIQYTDGDRYIAFRLNCTASPGSPATLTITKIWLE